jgi:hypothetical protein
VSGRLLEALMLRTAGYYNVYGLRIMNHHESSSSSILRVPTTIVSLVVFLLVACPYDDTMIR